MVRAVAPATNRVDIHSLIEYVKAKHGAKVLDWETLHRPVKEVEA